MVGWEFNLLHFLKERFIRICTILHNQKMQEPWGLTKIECGRKQKGQNTLLFLKKPVFKTVDFCVFCDV